MWLATLRILWAWSLILLALVAARVVARLWGLCRSLRRAPSGSCMYWQTYFGIAAWRSISGAASSGPFHENLRAMASARLFRRVAFVVQYGTFAFGAINLAEIVNLQVFDIVLGDSEGHARWVVLKSAFSTQVMLLAFCTVLGYWPGLMGERLFDISYMVFMARLGSYLFFYDTVYEYLYNCQWILTLRLHMALGIGKTYLSIVANCLFSVCTVPIIARFETRDRLGMVLLETAIASAIIIQTYLFSMERRKADAMQLALQAMFENQYDATCVCDEAGIILSATPRLRGIFNLNEDPVGFDLCSFAAGPDETMRLRRFIAGTQQLGGEQLQALHASFQPFSPAVIGTPMLQPVNETRQPVDVSLYMLKIPAVSPFSSNSQFMLGIKIHGPETGGTSWDVAVGSDASHNGEPRTAGVLQSDGRHGDGRNVEQGVSESGACHVGTNPSSCVGLAATALPIGPIRAGTSVTSQGSKLSVQSFWSALRLICGSDVRPRPELMEVLRDVDTLNSATWPSCATRVAQASLALNIEERLERSRARMPTREQAAACLTAAVVSSQHGPMFPPEIWAAIARSTGDAGNPPPPESPRVAQWERQRWFHAATRTMDGTSQGGNQMFLEFQAAMNRSRILAAEGGGTGRGEGREEDVTDDGTTEHDGTQGSMASLNSQEEDLFDLIYENLREA
mmetsp:Transcript_19740/g.54305  ORF Transcript_19740/g.54305 Transcript_19740/m.54305 type:complete len:681 (+) Transcript_19740:43-2085(+)